MSRWLGIGVGLASCVVVTGLVAVGWPSHSANSAPKPRSVASHWVGSWAASPSDASTTQSSLAHQTLRMIVTPHLGGHTLRVHLSNRFGKRAITLDQVNVGRQAKGASIVPRSNRMLRFHSRAAVRIAAGDDVVSDPVALTFGPFQKLSVSVYVDSGDRESDRALRHARDELHDAYRQR